MTEGSALSTIARLICLIALFPPGPPVSEPFGFEITYNARLRTQPFTGRVILFLSSKDAGEPRLDHNWMSRQPVFGQDVQDWKPGQPLRITRPMGFPFELTDLPRGRYRVQAVMHTNPDEPHSGKAAGNLFSKPVSAELDPAKGGLVRLEIAHKVKPPKKPGPGSQPTGKPATTASAADEPGPTLRWQPVELRSRLLSEFQKRDVYLRAMVVLPEAYSKSPNRRFPAIYVIPGFGGDLRQTAMYALMLGKSEVPFVRIALEGMCGLGHHVFANSDNNGPWGTALVEELIPHLEKEFRLIRESRARFLTGHSSGGWSSLWLQITHPDYFGGTWSTSPDSVDFHDFCGIDLYDRDANFLYLPNGEPRPIMRNNGEVRLWLPDFVRMEDAIGPGGQIQSFEAVFGLRERDGRPTPLFDRLTGRINPDVIKAWRRYDIVDKLRREWPELGSRLSGKITVIIGAEDNFYLDGAARRLKAALEDLGSDARVHIEPGKDHGSIMLTRPFRRMVDEMSAKFLASESKPGFRS